MFYILMFAYREINSLQQQLDTKKEEYEVLVKETDSLRLRLSEEKFVSESDRKDVTITVQNRMNSIWKLLIRVNFL